jgi:NAD(P)-dependent dehydrogenase (short-subunit alcohol dehydrogenase family)
MIWGAAGGIGGALVNRLAADAWTVVGVAREPGRIGPGARHVIEADVGDAFAVQRAVLETSRLVETIDLWIYAVGDIAATNVGDLRPADWRRLQDANLTGAYLATHYCLPYLSADAHLVYLGAVSERLRLPGLAAYAATKAGLEAYAATLAREERGRRVTVIRLAAVDTPLWAKVPFRLPPGALSPSEAAERILAAHAAGEKGVLDL